MKKLIIAHRGASRLARENTLEAFQKAIDVGADGIELDVRRTADGELAVFHDAAISGRKISKISFVQANGLAAKDNFQIPSLKSALELIAGKAVLQIEIKEPDYELQIAELALNYFKPDEFCIISFNFKVLKKIRSRYPHIKLGLIIGTRGTRFWQMLKFFISKNETLATVNILAINWKLWQAGFARLLPGKLPLAVWTADEPALIKSLLADERIASITSNVPDIALKIKNQIYAAQ